MSERPEPKVFDLVHYRGVWTTIEGFCEYSGTQLSTGARICARQLEPIMPGWWRYEPKRKCAAWGGCTLPAGHNMGQADVPENHQAPDRRERYAAAINATLLEFAVEPSQAAADAAMAVADEELTHAVQAGSAVQSQQIDRLREENARLRAELESSKAAHRAVWARHQARGQRIFDLQGKNARLREELTDEKSYRLHVDDENARLRAELSEVGAAIDHARELVRQYVHLGLRDTLLRALGDRR